MPAIYLFVNCAGQEIRYHHSSFEEMNGGDLAYCEALNHHMNKSMTEYRVVDE